MIFVSVDITTATVYFHLKSSVRSKVVEDPPVILSTVTDFELPNFEVQF